MPTSQPKTRRLFLFPRFTSLKSLVSGTNPAWIGPPSLGSPTRLSGQKTYYPAPRYRVSGRAGYTPSIPLPSCQYWPCNHNLGSLSWMQPRLLVARRWRSSIFSILNRSLSLPTTYPSPASNVFARFSSALGSRKSSPPATPSRLCLISSRPVPSTRSFWTPPAAVKSTSTTPSVTSRSGRKTVLPPLPTCRNCWWIPSFPS